MNNIEEIRKRQNKILAVGSYHPGYQAAPYVCKKCYDSCVMIEEIKTGQQLGGTTNDLRL